MGHHYRERHQTPATTTSNNLAGLNTGRSTVPSDDWTLEELRQYAKDNNQPSSGNKADLIERLTKA